MAAAALGEPQGSPWPFCALLQTWEAALLTTQLCALLGVSEAETGVRYV